jgi:hypothetical protein
MKRILWGLLIVVAVGLAVFFALGLIVMLGLRGM